MISQLLIKTKIDRIIEAVRQECKELQLDTKIIQKFGLLQKALKDFVAAANKAQSNQDLGELAEDIALIPLICFVVIEAEKRNPSVL